MSPFSQKQSQSQKSTSSGITRSNAATFGTDHREHPILRLQRTVGNQTVRRMLQTKRMISRPGDVSEREADHLAERVMRMPEPRRQPACACGGECAGCRNKPASPAQAQTARLGADHMEKTTAPPIVDEALRSAGRPLDAATRAFFEPRFGRDFGAVRVHADARASETARSVDARAFTVGSDIVFGSGEYAPDTADGRTLLAHELTHTVQQGAAVAERPIQRQAAPAVPRKTIWVNIGFDSSAQANEETMRKLRASIRVEKAAIASCCAVHNRACDIDVKQHYDWRRSNKPAPADGDYDSDVAADRELRDRNFDNIAGRAGGVKVLVTESTLSQTWQGVRIFPRANTPEKGILWNRALAAEDTLAHESGHAAGYTGDAEGGHHSTDPQNLMASGSIREVGATPDANWCQQIAATAR